jgi:hypothetical protein
MSPFATYESVTTFLSIAIALQISERADFPPLRQTSAESWGEPTNAVTWHVPCKRNLMDASEPALETFAQVTPKYQQRETGMKPRNSKSEIRNKSK